MRRHGENETRCNYSAKKKEKKRGSKYTSRHRTDWHEAKQTLLVIFTLKLQTIFNDHQLIFDRSNQTKTVAVCLNLKRSSNVKKSLIKTHTHWSFCLWIRTVILVQMCINLSIEITSCSFFPPHFSLSASVSMISVFFSDDKWSNRMRACCLQMFSTCVYIYISI